jgi:serine/threonine protein kinase
MEGNLYHLIKLRKGRPLAGGLVSSIFRQIVSGLDHIHSAGYFHRDMKPENVLVTTTGLFDYVSVSSAAPPKERDVVAIIKLADFGLARETKSKPPYTEYVSTRWYRAPEVLLLSRDYSNPVDMWALGTIMAELVNLRPLFPGVDQIDQVARICELLGDPIDEYGPDPHLNPMGGGVWPRGIKMAHAIGFQFPKVLTSISDIFTDSIGYRSVLRIYTRCLIKLFPSLWCTAFVIFSSTILINGLPVASASTTRICAKRLRATTFLFLPLCVYLLPIHLSRSPMVSRPPMALPRIRHPPHCPNIPFLLYILTAPFKRHISTFPMLPPLTAHLSNLLHSPPTPLVIKKTSPCITMYHLRALRLM